MFLFNNEIFWHSSHKRWLFIKTFLQTEYYITYIGEYKEWIMMNQRFMGIFNTFVQSMYLHTYVCMFNGKVNQNNGVSDEWRVFSLSLSLSLSLSPSLYLYLSIYIYIYLSFYLSLLSLTYLYLYLYIELKVPGVKKASIWPIHPIYILSFGLR